MFIALVVYSIIMFILGPIMAYAIINLLRKNEELEGTLEELLATSRSIITQITDIDVRGSFESDDETGVIYSGIRGMVLRLHSFLEDRDTLRE